MKICFGISPVPSIGTRDRRDNPDFFVIADHLRRYARSLCHFADIHHCPPTASAWGGWNPRKRKALPSTKTLDSAMAPAAKTGESSTPHTGYKSPAATGISAVL